MITKFKGIGAATFDRAVSLSIGASILAGVVAGSSFIYKKLEAKQLAEGITVVDVAVKEYYSTGNNYSMGSLKKSGYLPSNYDVIEDSVTISGYESLGAQDSIKAGSTSIAIFLDQAKYDEFSGDIYSMHLGVKSVENCINTLRTFEKTADIQSAHSNNNVIYAGDLPSKSGSVSSLETFCDNVSATDGLILHVFK